MFKYLAALTLGLALAQAPALAADAPYPAKVVKVVVPYPPDGPTDSAARVVAKSLGEQLGQPFIIENRGGASGTIGTAVVAREPADGYSLVVVAAHHVTNAATGMKLPYDPIKDFDPIGAIAYLPVLMAVNGNLVPAKDLKSLVEWIRAQKVPVQYACSGSGSLTQLWGELWARRNNLQLQNIPYKGSADAARAVVAGEVPLLFDVGGTTTTMIASGRLRGIVTAGSQRAPGLPDVPTAREAGAPDVEAQSFLGLLAPAGLPVPVRDKLNAALNKALQDPEVLKVLAAQGLSPAGGSAQGFGKMLADDLKRWSEVARAANISYAN
ncbi:MAG: tripartite tricarboxylate transporter substrate binding protein [Burkholderiaceae bacterium]